MYSEGRIGFHSGVIQSRIAAVAVSYAICSSLMIPASGRDLPISNPGSMSIYVRDALHFLILLLHRPLHFEVCLTLFLDALLLDISNDSRMHSLKAKKLVKI